MRKQSIEASIARNASSAPSLHPDLAHLYHRKIEKLQEAVAAPETRAEATEILRSLIESITLTPIDNGFEIELVGEIANMLALSDNALSTNIGNYASSVKVVAGAGFVQDPTRFELRKAV